MSEQKSEAWSDHVKKCNATGKFYHLYADGKTVKQMDFETFLKATNRRRWVLISVWYHGIGILGQDSTKFIPRKQLEQILWNSCNKTNKENGQ